MRCGFSRTSAISPRRTPLCDHQVAQLLQVGELAHRLHAQAPAAIVDLPGRDREVHRLQALGEVVEAEVVRGQAVGVDRDLDLVRRRAGDLHPRHARDALDPALELAVDQVVRAGQVCVSLARRTRNTGSSVVENFSTL